MEGEDLVLNLDFKKAASLMDSEIINRNHNILDSTVDCIEDSVLICENPEIELNPMRSEIFYLIPDFLTDPDEIELKNLKKEIEDYKIEFESLCRQVNDFANRTTVSLKNLYMPSNNLKYEINQILDQFEETIKNLCIPLISEQEGLNKIKTNNLNEKQKSDLNEDKMDIIYKIEQFKKESNKLNKKYYELFNQMYKAVQIICNNIKDIPSTISDFQNTIDEGMSKFEEILEQFTDKNNHKDYHKQLIKIKESFQLINKKKDEIIKQTEEKINNLFKQYKERRESFNLLKKDRIEIIENLKEKSESIKGDIMEVRKKNNQKKMKIPNVNIPDIVIEKVINCMDNSVNNINNANSSIFNIIIKIEIPFITLDLLFIMDITGSMEEYVDETKVRIIEIMDKIIIDCKGIAINLGFIGYRDVEEHKKKNYVNIEFTKNHQSVKDEINKIVVGGGDDTAEDVAWAFQQALKKNWKNKARFAILVTDAPCHGLKYHDPKLLDDYPQGVPNGENIENLVQQLIKKQISLLCIKLKESTDIMYEIFGKIYKNNVNKNCQYDIISMNSPQNLVDTIVLKASQFYINQ